MPELLAFQTDFASALRDIDRSGVHRWLAGDTMAIDGRMAIYRANAVAAADRALSAAYPVIRQVVGEEFFRGLVREFQRGAPSTSGDLTEFGATFNDFLANFEHTQTWAYLPDLARLEWAVHRAYGAADAPGWDVAMLGKVHPDQQSAIRLEWSPGLALIESGCPIVRIWTIHQPGYAGEFSVDWGEVDAAVVARDGFTVTVTRCNSGEARFLSASLDGATLGDAVSAALAHQADFDLGSLLSRAFAARLVCGVTL